MILGTKFCRLSLALECELVDLLCEKKNGLTLLKAAIDQYNTSIKLYLNNKNHSLF